jgi:hypothetical protein
VSKLTPRILITFAVFRSNAAGSIYTTISAVLRQALPVKISHERQSGLEMFGKASQLNLGPIL